MHFPRRIYAIQHNVTKRMYIGSSSNLNVRYQTHLNALRRGKHPVEDMQEDFDKYGEDYSLFILDTVFEWDERKKEYEHMKEHQSYIRGKGYNYKDRVFNR